MADPKDPTETVTIPAGLRWIVEKLAELHARSFTGNVKLALKPGSTPIVYVEEVVREEAPSRKR